MQTVSTRRRRRPAPVEPSLNLDQDRLVPTAEAARVCGLSAKTLRQLRCDRKGPRCLKVGETKQSRVLYPMSALAAWMATMSVRGGAHESQ